MSQSRQSISALFFAFVALMLLLTLTVEAARHDLGRWNFLVAVLIASVKAVLIMACFMHVRRSAKITQLVVCAGFFWLAILFALSLADYWTRDWMSLNRGNDSHVSITNHGQHRQDIDRLQARSRFIDMPWRKQGPRS